MPLKNYKKVKAEAKKYQQDLNKAADRSGKNPPFISDELLEKNLKNEKIIEKYEKAHKFNENVERMIEYKNNYHNKNFGLAKENGSALDRCIVYFMDPSGTPEADKKNDELLARYFDPDRRGEIVQEAFDRIRNFNYGEAFKKLGDFEGSLDYYYEHYQEIEALFLIDNIITFSESSGLHLAADHKDLQKYDILAETFSSLKNGHFFYSFEGCFTYDYDKESTLETEMKYMNVKLDASQPGRKEFNGCRFRALATADQDKVIADKFTECHNLFEYQMQNKETDEIVDFNKGLNDPNCIAVKTPKELFDLYNSSQVIPVAKISPVDNSKVVMQVMNQYSAKSDKREYVAEALEASFMAFESAVHNHMLMDPLSPSYEKDTMALNEFGNYLKDEFKVPDTMINYVMDRNNLSKPLLLDDVKKLTAKSVDNIMKAKAQPSKKNEVDGFLEASNKYKPLSKFETYFLEILQDKCMDLKEKSTSGRLDERSMDLIKKYDNYIARTDEDACKAKYDQQIKNAVYTRANAVNAYENMSGASRFFSYFVPNSWTQAGRQRDLIASYDKSFEKNGFSKEKVEELFDRFVEEDNMEVNEQELPKEERVPFDMEDPMKEESKQLEEPVKEESKVKENVVENDDLQL